MKKMLCVCLALSFICSLYAFADGTVSTVRWKRFEGAVLQELVSRHIDKQVHNSVLNEALKFFAAAGIESLVEQNIDQKIYNEAKRFVTKASKEVARWIKKGERETRRVIKNSECLLKKGSRETQRVFKKSEKEVRRWRYKLIGKKKN